MIVRGPYRGKRGLERERDSRRERERERESERETREGEAGHGLRWSRWSFLTSEHGGREVGFAVAEGDEKGKMTLLLSL